MTKRFALLATFAVLAACSGGGGSLPAPPTSVATGPGAHAASATVIPTSAYTSVTLPCQTEVDGLAVAPDGSAWIAQPFTCTPYVADDMNSITRITISGAVTVYHTPTVNSGPDGIVLGADSNLYAIEANKAKIVRIDPNSGAMTEFTIPPDQGQPPRVFYPGAGPDGNLWFVDSGFGNGTTGLGTFNITTHQFTWYPLNMPVTDSSHAVTGPNGTIWVSNYNIQHNGTAPFGVYTTGGVKTAEFQVPTPIGDLTLASDGNIWFTQLNSGTPEEPSLGRITQSGAITSFPLPGSDANDPILLGIAQAHDGNLYSGLFMNNAILRSTLNGTMTVFSFPTSCNIVQTALVAAGSGNTLWAADNGNTKRMYLLNLDLLHP